mmetsp:Transcript_51611/g.167653  ORF Transcript_51611/g.167653 Transcript_51611/m.167653 type:complete len:146 (+) Transcript_51611:612-1049(+)
MQLLASSGDVVMSFMVTFMYWVLVYKPEKDAIAGLNVMMHGGSFVLALVDLLLTRQPYYIQHVFVPFIFAVVYASFSVVYYLAGGTAEDGVSRYIYEALDWSKPEAAGKLVGMLLFLAVPLLYAITCLIVSCRIKSRKAAEGWRS